MPQLVWTADASGVVDYYNARAEEYDGLRRRTDGSWSWEPVVHPEDAAGTIKAWSEAVRVRRGYEIEHRIRMRDGTYRWHISRAAPAPTEDGTPRWYGTATDIHESRVAQETARASEERLSQAVLVADLGIFEHDHLADTIYWSPTLRSIMGIGPDEPLTLDGLLGLIHPDDRPVVAARIARAHDPAGTGSFASDSRMVRQDGSIIRVSVRSRTFFEGTGAGRRPRRTVGAMADVSEQTAAESRLRESEERLRLATEVAAVGTYDLDLVDRSTYWSRPLRRIMGIGPRDRVPTLSEVAHPEDLAAVTEAFEASTHPGGEGSLRLDYRIVRPDGEVRWVSTRGRTLFEGSGVERRAVRAIGAMIDVTDRRHGEDLRDAFIGMLSHELRTPVTSIYGGSQVLLRPGLPAGARDEILEGVVEESERLARLVENLLVIAKLERNAELGRWEPILLRPIVDRIVVRARREHPGIALETSGLRGLPAANGDEGAVELILSNLVSNAIKYGAGRPIDVTADGRHGRIELRVLDRGPGLGVADPRRLFELFYRVDAARQVAAGAGIGLYVVRALARAMGGDAWAAERAGGGSEFGVSLPVFTAVEGDSEGDSEGDTGAAAEHGMTG